MSMKVAQNSAAAKVKKKKTTGAPATESIREKVLDTAAAAQTANAVQQSQKVQQLDPQMAGALYGAAQRAAADNYNAALTRMQNYWQNGSGVMAYGELQGYQSALKNYQDALLATVSTGLQQFTGPRGQARFQQQMTGLNGEMQRVNNMLGMSEADYNQNVYWPEKYRGSDAASVNTAMARLRFDGDAGRDELAWLRQHQYDYWTTDQLDRGIEATQGSYDRQRDRNVNSAFLQSQIDAMRAARENNAYRETTSDWTESDFSNMENLARFSGEQRDAATGGTVGQLITIGQNSAEVNRLRQYFRDKGYSDDEIDSLVNYFLRNQHLQDRQQQMQQLTDWTNQNVGTQIAGSIASVPLNLLSGLGYVDLAIQNATAGQDAITGQREHIDQYSPLTGLSDASSTIRGAVSGELNPFWSFMYQTGMSMADSAAALATGGGSEFLLGGSAAMQGARDAYARGATDWQALAIGGLNGAAEAAFEHLSLGNLRALKTSQQVARRTFKEILKETAIQAGVEGSEEVFTTIANTFADQLVMGDKSQLNEAIRNYMAQGMTEEEATRKAIRDWLGSTALDFVGGALSGGVMGGGVSVIGNAQIDHANRKTGNAIIEAGNTQELIDQGLAAPEGSAAYTAAQQTQNAKEGSKRQSRHAGETYRALQLEDTRQAVQGRLEQMGAKNAEEMSDAVIRQIQGQRLSARQAELVNTRQAQRVLFEYKYAQRGMQGPAEWTQNLDTRNFERAASVFARRAETKETAAPASIKEFAEGYGEQAKGVERVYELTPNADVADFATSFDAAYAAGQQGMELETLQKHNAMRALEPEQVELAWQMGKDSAKSSGSEGQIATPSATARNDKADWKEGGHTNGTEVHLRRSGERADGARTLGEVRRVAEASKRDQTGKKAAGRPADSGALKVTVGEKISALRLGVENGATAQTVYTVTGNDTKSMKKARALAAEHGMKVVFFAGGNLGVHTRADKHGYVASARGLVQGDTVYVRVDHEQFTADQLMRHEMGHKAIENGSVDTDAVRERIRKEFGPEQFNTIVQLYLEAYAETGMTADEIWEEIVCDSLGDMNIFSDTFEGLQRKTGELLRATKKAANETRGEKREQESRAPPEQKFSTNLEVLERKDVDWMDNRSSIKQQLTKHADDLNEMDPVVVVEFNGTHGDLVDAIMREVSRVGGQRMNRNGVSFDFDRGGAKSINTHARNSELQAAALASPYVAKYGKLIAGQRNHENQGFPTLTFGAPAVINGETVNVGLAVKFESDGRPRAVNVEYQSGKPFKIDMKNAPKGLNSRVYRYSKGTALSTMGADNSISDFNGKSKPKTSQDLESLADLRRENRELRERAKKWRRETLRSKGRETVRAEDVKKAANVLIEDMQSTIRPSEITGDLTALAEYMMRGEGKNDRTPVWAEIKERAGVIAEKLVDNAEAMREGGDPENYRELKQYLRDTKLTIDDADKGDIPDGYNHFRRQNIGTLRLGSDGLSVESAYEELQGAFGYAYFPAKFTHPAEQLMRIADVINRLKPVYENPHTYNRAEAVEWASNAIIDTLLSEDVRQAAPTFADKQAAKYDAYVRRSHAAIKRVREQRDRQIAKIKQEHREQKVRARERKTRSEMWRGIIALKKDFQRMVEKPEQGNSRHAPMGLAIALRNIADCFDREGRRDGSVKLPEFKEAVVRLRDEYESMKDDGVLNFYYDPVVMERLAAVNLELRDVSDPTALSTAQLRQIYDALRMCKHGITTANKFIAMEYAKGIMDAGRQWGGEVMRASPLLKKGVGGQLLNYQLRPDSFFARISGFAKNSIGEQVQQMFVNGTEKMLRIQQDFYYSLEKYSTDKRFDALTRRGSKALVDVGLKDMDGNAVKLTRDQMLAVYMHLRSEDNLRAAAYGGLDVPNAKAYYTGNVAQSFDESIRTACIDASTVELVEEQRRLQKLAREDAARGEIRPEVTERLDEIQAELQAAEGEMIGTLLDVRAEIEKQLTDFEKELVAAADAWMRKSADYINAETLAMYGIEKANVEHYWTIHRNTNFVNTDMRTAVDEINLENWGSLKERVQSHAPVKLTGFIFELDNHTKKMSQFCGFAAVQRDFNKLYNTRLPGQHTSLSEQVQKKFGSGEKKLGVSGQEYIDNYIKSISGGEHVKPSPIAWFRMNLPRATLSANFRVALSQVASVPTAAAEVGWGPMVKGFARYSVKGLSAKQQEQLARTDPWFWQRSRGEGGMREFAEMKESTLAFDRAYNKVAGTKVGKAILNWCQRFDMYATYTQWAMAEEWVKSNRKDLKKGSDAWNEAVSHKYRDIIRKTQPNYTVTERSDLLRDSRETMKWATMYKTQSNQNLNILYDATARLRQYTRDHKAGRNGVTDADLKEARQQFARAYTGVILGGTVTFVLFRALANALLHSMNAYRDDDNELTLESFLNGLWEETLGAMAGMFLLGSEIEEIVTAAVTGGRYWGLSDSAIGALSDVLTDSLALLNKLRAGEATFADYRKVIYSFMAPLGIPGENIMKIVNGIRYHVEDIQNGEFLSFEAGVNRTAAQQASRFMNAMRAGDTAKMGRIYDEMIKASGAEDPESAVQSALRDRIKSAFIGDEEGTPISEKQALDLLERFCGKSGDDAQKLVNKWSFEKQFGFPYGKESIVNAALDGEITIDEARSAWTDVGGLDAAIVDNRTKKLQFCLDNPGMVYENVKTDAVKGWYDHAKPAHIDVNDYMEYWADMSNIFADVDANGNSVTNSRRGKIIDYIDSLDITDEQKDALFLTQYAESSLKYCTWRSDD